MVEAEGSADAASSRRESKASGSSEGNLSRRPSRDSRRPSRRPSRRNSHASSDVSNSEASGTESSDGTGLRRRDSKRRMSRRRTTKTANDVAKEVAGLWKRAQKAGIPNLPPTTSAVIFFHGQGECEEYWRDLLSQVKVPDTAKPCRWLFPRANKSPSTVRGGVPTNQWFDVKELPVCRFVRDVPDRPRHPEDPADVTVAVARAHAAINALEEEGIPASRIVLAGFGMGGCVALHATMRYERALAGGALLSSWVPCQEALALVSTDAGRKADILWCHGEMDKVIELKVAASDVKFLEGLGANVDYCVFEKQPHGTNPEIISTFEAWLAARLDGSTPAEQASEQVPEQVSEQAPEQAQIESNAEPAGLDSGEIQAQTESNAEPAGLDSGETQAQIESQPGSHEGGPLEPLVGQIHTAAQGTD
eukprot:gnl/TRDRNA2_/TRDRNA2_187470_c0_seq1.p1 gnl/TRDRNA2_/TRDRNA2_187470_c0~~gnl/TRDRNA2_/TRDRNA2_187470_c0_seq1.p1  ORF type:complete len:438 (-),score=67.03 gnl/TRDRNA2_/TRDRNA2_187470_c0_seq1:22-1284(-)